MSSADQAQERILQVGKLAEEYSANNQRLLDKSIYYPRPEIAVYLFRLGEFLEAFTEGAKGPDLDQALSAWGYIESKRELINEILQLHKRQTEIRQQWEELELDLRHL